MLLELLTVDLCLWESNQNEVADFGWLVRVDKFRFSDELIDVEIVDLDLFLTLLKAKCLEVFTIHNCLLPQPSALSFRLGSLFFHLLFG